MDETIKKNNESNKVISELITHVNRLEQKINSFQETISEINDVELVNKLDIINLKNGLEKLKLTLPSISQEQASNLQEIANLAEGTSVKEILSIGKRVDEISNKIGAFEERVAETESHPTDALITEIEFLKRKVESQSSGKMSSLDKENRTLIRELEAKIRNLSKGKITQKQAAKTPKTQSIESEISKLKIDVKAMSERISGLKPVKIPEGVGGIDMMKEDISNLLSLKGKTESIESKIRQHSAAINELQKPVKIAKPTKPGTYPEVQKSLNRLSRESVQLRQLLDSQEKEIRKFGTSLSSVKHDFEKKVKEEVKKGKKETISYILKELRRMVSA